MQFQAAFHEEMPHGVAYMTVTVVPNGTQIAYEVRNTSEHFTSKGCAPETLRDLFDILDKNPPKSISMLRTTWSVLAGYLQMPADRVTIDSVFENKEGFPRFLESMKYARNSIRSYANYERILLAKAEEFGWNPNETFPEAWRGVLALASEYKCVDIAKSLARIRRAPVDVTLEDVDCWVQLSTGQGRSFKYMQSKKTWFCRLLRNCACTELTPISHLREKIYGIPLEQLPLDIKKEVMELLRWKQSVYSHGRPKDARHRKTTSLNLQQVTCSVIGYATNILGECGLTSLSQVVTEPVIGAFAEWSINERQVKLGSLQQNLRLLLAAMRHHPAYKTLEWGWFQALLEGLPVEPESELKDRKAAKYVEYPVVEAIPGKIRADRRIAEMKRPHQTHLLVMKELMMRWLVTLPWRQRNLRECRIGGGSPNLFKGRIPPLSDIDKPQWVKEEELRNPAAEFWQFKFSSDETKMGNGVRALLPEQLISILEEYLLDHRKHLLIGTDPGTLFIDGAGTAMSKNQLTCMVSELTVRYCGKRITPHPFRDIVAFTWLKAHPKDYLTLSKMLWHRSIRTTINVYGGRFNESSGVCAMEAWLNERMAKTT
jgi:integrase